MDTGIAINPEAVRSLHIPVTREGIMPFLQYVVRSESNGNIPRICRFLSVSRDDDIHDSVNIVTNRTAETRVQFFQK